MACFLHEHNQKGAAMQTLIFVLDVSLPGLDEQEKLEFLEQMMPELSEYRQQKVRQIWFLKDKLC